MAKPRAKSRYAIDRVNAFYSVKEFAIEWRECVRSIAFPSMEIVPLVMRFGSYDVYDGIRFAYRECRVGRVRTSAELVIYVRGYCEGAFNG